MSTRSGCRWPQMARGVTWADATSPGTSRSFLLPAATPAALHRAQREHHRCAPRSSAPRAVCGFLWLLGEPQALPSSRPPAPPCCGLAASRTLQTQPCLKAFAHSARARPQTPLPQVATWPPLLRPFRSPGGRVLTARTSASSARVVICLRPASRLLRRPREQLRVSSGNTPGFEGSWPHPGCGPNSERRGERSGLSQRNGPWRGHKRSPVGPPTIFL